MIDGEGVFVTAHMIGDSGINKLIVRVSQEAAASHHGVGVVCRLVRRGGGRGGSLFPVFLFSEFIGGLLEVAIVTGMTLAGTIPTLYVRIRGAGRPLVSIVGGLAAFMALSALLRNSEYPRSGHPKGLLRLYVSKRLLDRGPSSDPSIRKMSNLRSPC